MFMDEPLGLRSLLSGTDAIQLLELVHMSISCDGEDDFKGLFPKIREIFHFDSAIVVLGNQKNKDFIASGGVDIDFPEAFFREYGSMDLLHKDLLVKDALASRRLQYWPGDWERLGQSEQIVSLCLDYHMPEGCIHSARSVGPAKNDCIFSFSGSSIAHDARSSAILELIIPHLHMALGHIVNTGGSQLGPVILSIREKEVLNWLKQGKSSWEMSVILGISERTVNFHVYNMMRKLDAVNRTQAVAAALRHGLIELD
jgi:LuxR family transcriptional regulator, quorum-sensing system regulator CviR